MTTYEKTPRCSPDRERDRRLSRNRLASRFASARSTTRSSLTRRSKALVDDIEQEPQAAMTMTMTTTAARREEDEDDTESDSDSLQRRTTKRIPSYSSFFSSSSVRVFFFYLVLAFATFAALDKAAILVDGLTPSSSSSKPHRSHSARQQQQQRRRPSSSSLPKKTTSSDLSASSISLDRVSNGTNNHRRKRNQQQQQRQGQNQNQKRHRSASASASSPSNSNSAVAVPSIFVKNLHYGATREDILASCRKRYGGDVVESVWVPRGNDKKGYASIVFRDAATAREALSNGGRLDVLGRRAYLVENTRPADPRGDAYRFLAAFSRGDDRLEDNSDARVRREVAAARTPRNVKERGILAAALARLGARDELLAILNGGVKGKGEATPPMDRRRHPNGSSPPPVAAAASTSVYNAALSALTVSTSRECRLVQDLVRMAEDGPGVNARTYATAIGSIKRGLSNSAAMALDDLRTRRNARRGCDSVERDGEKPSLEIDRGITNSAAMALDDLRDIASLFLKTAKTKGVANHVVYNELISCLGKMAGTRGSNSDGKPGSAERASAATGDASGTETMTTTTTSRSSSWKMATDVLDQMFDDRNVDPTEVSLNAAIASCATAGEIEAALSIYENGFARAGVEPTIVTTNSLLSAVHRWIKNKRRHRNHHHHHSTAATPSTSNAAPSLDPADATEALGVVRKLVDDAVARGDNLDGDPITVNALISVYGAAGDTARALELFERARAGGTATIVTANAALAALASDGNVEDATALVRSLPDTDVASWNTALSACGRAGDLGSALRLLDEMPHDPDARTYVSVFSAVTGEDRDGSSSSSSSATKTPDAIGTLLARADDAGVATTFVLNAALAACDRMGDIDAARSLFEDGFAKRRLVPDVVSYNTMLRALGKTDPDSALELFSTMVDALQNDDASDGNVPIPDEQSYCSVMAALAAGGMHEKALGVLETCHLPKNPAVHGEALRACCVASDPERALELHDKMRAEGPVPDAVATTVVLTACARSGRSECCDAGLELFERLDDPDAIAYNAAISLATAKGDSDGAFELLNRLVKSPNATPDAVSYCSAIAACETTTTTTNGAVEGGDRRRRTLTDRAVELLAASRNAIGPDAGCTIATVQTLAAAGELDEAIALVTGDPFVPGFDDQSRYVLYRTVQVACASRGRDDDADRMARAVRDQNLTALAPLATARVGGSLAEFDNRVELPVVDTRDAENGENAVASTAAATIGDASIANTVMDLVEETGHEFVVSALPLEFQARSPRKTQEVSLANHAEKKALARLLLEEARSGVVPTSRGALSISINFKMCADCHAFFKAASGSAEWGLKGRTITVREPTLAHSFRNGECSCGDRWRWEQRRDDGLLRTRTESPTAAAGRRRFGRLPPKLVAP